MKVVNVYATEDEKDLLQRAAKAVWASKGKKGHVNVQGFLKLAGLERARDILGIEEGQDEQATGVKA